MTGMDGDRVKAMAGVALLHAFLGYAFLTGLALDVVREAGTTLKLFEITEPAPPPPIEQSRPNEPETPDPEGAAAPPNIESRPTPVVAPPREIRLDVPTPVVTAPRPTPLPPGPDPTAGASDRAGPGWGAGGQGSGTGSGASGTGIGGGGGLGQPARHLSGRITNSDYPRHLERARIEGAVVVRFTALPSGRVADCTILRSSLVVELDDTTCALIEHRFRFRPALDVNGQPTPEEIVMTYYWRIRSRLRAQY